MNPIQDYRCRGVIATLVLVSAQPALATDALPESTSDSLAEIVVTAEKRAERLQDVPLSITAATGDQLRELGITNTDDLAKLVPDFTFVKSAYGLPIYFIRGVGFYDTSLGVSPAVTVYTDQIPLPYSPMARGATLDLERVEVLKGPQGTLFGENSTGGAINYIAAKPTDTFQAGTDVTYGRFEEVDVGGFVSGPISDTLSARLAVRNEYRGDWQEGYTTPEQIGEKRFLDSRLTVDWKPSDVARFELQVTGWRDTSDTQQPQFIQYDPLTTPAEGGRPPGFPIASFPPAPDDPRAAAWVPGGPFKQDNTFYQFGLRGDINLGNNITLTSLTSYADFNGHLPEDFDATVYDADITTDNGEISSLFQELRVSGTVGDRTKWMLGGNFQHDVVDEQFIFDPASNSGDHIGPYDWDSFLIDNNQDVSTKSVFGSLDFALTERLTAQVAARYTDQDRLYTGCTRDNGNGQIAQAFTYLSSSLTGRPQYIAPGDCITLSENLTPAPFIKQTLDQDNAPWRVSLNWKPDTNTLLYANVTKGFKAGSFETSGQATAAENTGVPQESVLAYELGTKDTISRSVEIDGAAFYYNYLDKQLFGYAIIEPFGNLPSLVSIPKSRIVGAEFNTILRPLDGLQITVGATYLTSRVLANPPNPTGPFGTIGTFVGDSFPYTPRWQGVADALYTMPFSGTLNAFVGGALSGRTETTAALSSNVASTEAKDGLLNIPGYALLDLRTGVEARNGVWHLELWGRNVTNKFYVTSATHEADYVYRFAGMPATFGVTGVYRFGK